MALAINTHTRDWLDGPVRRRTGNLFHDSCKKAINYYLHRDRWKRRGIIRPMPLNYAPSVDEFPPSFSLWSTSLPPLRWVAQLNWQTSRSRRLRPEIKWFPTAARLPKWTSFCDDWQASPTTTQCHHNRQRVSLILLLFRSRTPSQCQATTA